MLVKNENEWCWCLGEYVGYPEKSIEDAVKDFADSYPAYEVPKIRVGLSIRQIASVYSVSGTFVRNRLLAVGLNLERKKVR